ncbi:MAG: chromosome segregation protein SMC [Planctomycetota bacterium]|nr:MAG: chromosome segregation protein SMC [Planctomycetota bacterium]
MPLLCELKLRNLLSFGGDTAPLALGPLNVLIGPNGCGKSNLVEAVGLLRAAPADLVAPIREGGGIRDWLWKGADRPTSAVLEVLVEYPQGKQPLRYRLELGDAGGRLEIIDERIENARPFPGHEKPIFYFGYEGGRPMLNVCGDRRYLRREEVDAQRSILSQRKDPDQYPELTYLGEVFARIRVYREWSFGRYTAPRVPQPADLPNDVLAEDGRNLGLVLSRLRRDPQTKQRLVEHLRKLYDGIDDFEVTVEGGTVQIFLQEGRWAVPATRLSDGTLRYLGLLAILCHPSPPPLVCLEEPELGLHPDLQAHLATLLREAASRTQLIVTTHSDILVDALTDTPDAVIVCEKEHGCTQLQRLEAERLRPWLESYRLGELWTRGEIGGTRW